LPVIKTRNTNKAHRHDTIEREADHTPMVKMERLAGSNAHTRPSEKRSSQLLTTALIVIGPMANDKTKRTTRHKTKRARTKKRTKLREQDQEENMYKSKGKNKTKRTWLRARGRTQARRARCTSSS
jgi:hypothetical protein